MRKIVTIDCDYIHPRFAAAFLLIENGRAAFIENNTAHATPKLLAALAENGLSPEAVDYLIVTHVHLDHAGGTSALLAHCPRATVLAHPKAARTLVDPSRLVASARKVYGDAAFEKLYGEIRPIDAGRVRAMADEETLALGSRTLRFLHTKGHATHHFCVLDSGSDGIFTGDAFGLRYPALQSHGLFVFPSTSPIDFDPDEARRSVRRIAATGAKRAFLTHYGEVEQVAEAADQLVVHLDAHERVLLDAVKSPLAGAALAKACEAKLREHFVAFTASLQWTPSPDEWALLALDIEINAQGIAYVAEKRRTASAAP